MLNWEETPKLELPKSLDGEQVNCARKKAEILKDWYKKTKNTQNLKCDLKTETWYLSLVSYNYNQYPYLSWKIDRICKKAFVNDILILLFLCGVGHWLLIGKVPMPLQILLRSQTRKFRKKKKITTAIYNVNSILLLIHTSYFPRFGFCFPAKIFKAVDFPIPLVPTNPSTSPGRGIGNLYTTSITLDYINAIRHQHLVVQ